jgi:hypothetical protein
MEIGNLISLSNYRFTVLARGKTSMANLLIENNGPLILSTNYWESDLDRAGMLYCSINSGAFRLLLPRGWEDAINEMRTGSIVAISRGPHQPSGLELSLNCLGHTRTTTRDLLTSLTWTTTTKVASVDWTSWTGRPPCGPS